MVEAQRTLNEHRQQERRVVLLENPWTPQAENARLAKENAALQRKLHVLTLDYARVSSELQALRRCLGGSVASTPVVPRGKRDARV